MLDTDELPAQISAVFDGYTTAQSCALIDLRALIFEEAARLGVGPVAETLKWGQPSYVVTKGTPLRLALLGGAPAVFVHCQTTIIEAARALFGGVAEFSGTRALILGGDARAEAHVICAALTYHQRGA